VYYGNITNIKMPKNKKPNAKKKKQIKLEIKLEIKSNLFNFGEENEEVSDLCKNYFKIITPRTPRDTFIFTQQSSPNSTTPLIFPKYESDILPKFYCDELVFHYNNELNEFDKNRPSIVLNYNKEYNIFRVLVQINDDKKWKKCDNIIDFFKKIVEIDNIKFENPQIIVEEDDIKKFWTDLNYIVSNFPSICL
jgi:hypothetical protein